MESICFIQWTEKKKNWPRTCNAGLLTFFQFRKCPCCYKNIFVPVSFFGGKKKMEFARHLTDVIRPCFFNQVMGNDQSQCARVLGSATRKATSTGNGKTAISLDKQNKSSVHFSVHFSAVTARLRRENAYFHALWRTWTQDNGFLFLFLNFDTHKNCQLLKKLPKRDEFNEMK